MCSAMIKRSITWQDIQNSAECCEEVRRLHIPCGRWGWVIHVGNTVCGVVVCGWTPATGWSPINAPWTTQKFYNVTNFFNVFKSKYPTYRWRWPCFGYHVMGHFSNDSRILKNCNMLWHFCRFLMLWGGNYLFIITKSTFLSFRQIPDDVTSATWPEPSICGIQQNIRKKKKILNEFIISWWFDIQCHN